MRAKHAGQEWGSVHAQTQIQHVDPVWDENASCTNYNYYFSTTDFSRTKPVDHGRAYVGDEYNQRFNK